MQKNKFQISGMHCRSCSSLIELKLKEHGGIIEAKVNAETHKAVVVYDEKKINESAIHQIVSQAGDYEVVEAEETPEENKEDSQTTHSLKQKSAGPSPKTSLLLGFLISFSILSLIFNIVLMNKLAKPAQGQVKTDSSTQGQNINSGANPSPAVQPTNTNQAAAIQTFTVTKDNHVRGDFNAPITLVEFSDFECPYCEKHYPTLKQALSNYQGKVRLVYKHFPLSFHPNSQKAAEASECASQQGKFWEYHDKLFDNQPSGYSLDKFKQWAKDLSLDTQKFNNCLDTGEFAQKVKTDYQEGITKGVNGTPATFVNGQLVTGALPYDSFKQIIDGLLNQ